MPKQSAEWPAAFAAAAELARRGYSVAFFLGNQPTYDALVSGNSSQNQFPVQIKGFKSKPKKDGAFGTAILVGDLSGGQPDDWFIIVYAQMYKSLRQATFDAFEFFVDKRRDLQTIKNRGAPAVPKFAADWLYYDDLGPFRDAWQNLPPP
jgi:hypothetical protein